MMVCGRRVVMAVEEVQRAGSVSTTVWTQEKNLDQAEAEKPAKAVSAPKGQVEPGAAAKKKQVSSQDKKRVEAATQQLNDFMKRNSIQLKFSVDGDTKEIVVRVVQKQTGKVIRQIPSEEALKIEKAFDSRRGLLVKEKA
jgi:flagellar protein FlaG